MTAARTLYALPPSAVDRPEVAALYLHLCVQVQTRITPLLVGPPGCGKTSILSQALPGENVVVLAASQLSPEDLTGLPKSEPGSKDLTYARMPWMRRVQACVQKDEPALIFLDEVNTAQGALRAALLTGLMDNRWGDMQLPPTVMRVAACNPAEISVGNQDFEAPLLQRFAHLPWSLPFDAPSVLSYWGAARNAPQVHYAPPSWETALPEYDGAMLDVVGYLQANPTEWQAAPKRMRLAESSAQIGDKGYTTPRQWQAVAWVLAAARAHRASRAATEMAITGLIGSLSTAPFLAYLLSRTRVSPQQVFDGTIPLADVAETQRIMVFSLALSSGLRGAFGADGPLIQEDPNALTPQQVERLRARVSAALAGDPEERALAAGYHKAIALFNAALAAGEKACILTAQVLSANPWLLQAGRAARDPGTLEAVRGASQDSVFFSGLGLR